MSDKQPTEQAETWKPVPGFEEWYSVSTIGRIRRDKKTANSCAGTILKATPQTAGYPCVQLFKGSSPRSCRLVHRLVAQAFLDPPTNDRACINHKDGNQLNNNVGNLEWCTPMENVRHAREVLGYNPKDGARARVPRGEAHYKHILTRSQVDDIRKRWAESGKTLNQRAEARRYGVKRGAIFAVVHGQSWKPLDVGVV